MPSTIDGGVSVPSGSIISCPSGGNLTFSGGSSSAQNWYSVRCTGTVELAQYESVSDYCDANDCGGSGDGTGDPITGSFDGTVTIQEVSWLTFDQANTVLGEGILPVLLVAALFAMALRMFNL